jgi:hypothetical protein
MRIPSTRALAGAMVLIVAAFVALQLAPPASAQSGPGWVTLLDGKNLGDWDRVGKTNWQLARGAVVADGKPSRGPAFLVTEKKYRGVQIRVEFWSGHRANSGVFIPCQDDDEIDPRKCYEINIYDQRRDPTYGTGSVVHFVEVIPMPKAGGKWNTLEITARGRQITLILNGKNTVDFRNNMFQGGYIAIQHGGGVIKFRKIAIR